MNRRQLLHAGAVVGAAGLTAPGRAEAEHGDSSPVGSWFGTITATHPPLGSFNDLLSLHEGGVVTESRRYYVVPPPPFPPLLETTGHGAWKRTGGRQLEAFFRFLLQEPPPGDGAPIGTDNIRLTLTHDRARDRLQGTFLSQVRDVAGNVLLQVGGTFEAERIKV